MQLSFEVFTMAVSDITITIATVAREFALQVFDKMLVERTCAIDEDRTLTCVVSHEDTKSGITRSMVKLSEDFLHSVTGAQELATAHLVFTYKSGEGRTKSKDLAAGLMTWLQASTNAALLSISSKLYGD